MHQAVSERDLGGGLQWPEHPCTGDRGAMTTMDIIPQISSKQHTEEGRGGDSPLVRIEYAESRAMFSGVDLPQLSARVPDAASDKQICHCRVSQPCAMCHLVIPAPLAHTELSRDDGGALPDGALCTCLRPDARGKSSHFFSSVCLPIRTMKRMDPMLGKRKAAGSQSGGMPHSSTSWKCKQAWCW